MSFVLITFVWGSEGWAQDTVHPRKVLYTIYTPSIQRSSCLHLLSAMTKGLSHQPWLLHYLFFETRLFCVPWLSWNPLLDQAALELTEIHLPMQGLKVWATTTTQPLFFILLCCICTCRIHIHEFNQSSIKTFRKKIICTKLVHTSWNYTLKVL